MAGTVRLYEQALDATPAPRVQIYDQALHAAAAAPTVRLYGQSLIVGTGGHGTVRLYDQSITTVPTSITPSTMWALRGGTWIGYRQYRAIGGEWT